MDDKTRLFKLVSDDQAAVHKTLLEVYNSLKERGYKIYYPEPILCTDNAAMIASAGYYRFMSGVTSNSELNAVPNLKIGDINQ